MRQLELERHELVCLDADCEHSIDSELRGLVNSGSCRRWRRGHTLALAADPEGQLKYNTTSLTAKAGTVTIAFANTAPVAHNVTISSSSGAVVGATPTFQGGTKTLSLSLKAGTYKFYCTVPGHRAAGMEGTLTVQ